MPRVFGKRCIILPTLGIVALHSFLASQACIRLKAA